MSAGRFIKTFYEADSGTVYNIKVQPESGGPNNPVATGPATGAVSVRARGSKRMIGIVARRVNLEWTGAPPAGYDDRGNVSCPIYLRATFNGLSVGNTFTYLGTEARIIGLSPESRR